MTSKCHKQGCEKASNKTKKCNACGNSFHNACGEFASYRGKTKPHETVHLCSSCNAIPENFAGLTLRYSSRSNSTSSHHSKRSRIAATSDDSDTSDEEEEPDLKSILKAVNKRVKKTDCLVTDLTATAKNFNASLNTRCDGIDVKIGALQNELSQLKKAHAAEMDAMEEKLDALDFKTKTEVYIHGYSHAGEAELNLMSAVIHLAEHLDVTITERDVQRTRLVKRRPNKVPVSFANAVRERPPIIAVDFYSHETALRLVDAKKSYGKLTNQVLLENSDPSTISVSFPLNREKYELLMEAKARAALHNIKYVWNSKGLIFMRETDGARAIKIKNAANLDALLPAQRSTEQPPEAQMDTTSPK